MIKVPLKRVNPDNPVIKQYCDDVKKGQNIFNERFKPCPKCSKYAEEMLESNTGTMYYKCPCGYVFTMKTINSLNEVE